MKKKLVKQPLPAYASGKKGDVYGYDWGSAGCILSIAAGIGGLALFLTGAGGIAGAMVTSASLHSIPFSCY